MLIQKALAEIRELRNEEIDLVGGSGYTTEVSIIMTYSNVSYCGNQGCGTVSVCDDATTDVTTDWV